MHWCSLIYISIFHTHKYKRHINDYTYPDKLPSSITVAKLLFFSFFPLFFRVLQQYLDWLLHILCTQYTPRLFIVLPCPPECWDSRHASPHTASRAFFPSSWEGLLMKNVAGAGVELDAKGRNSEFSFIVRPAYFSSFLTPRQCVDMPIDIGVPKEQNDT